MKNQYCPLPVIHRINIANRIRGRSKAVECFLIQPASFIRITIRRLRNTNRNMATA